MNKRRTRINVGQPVPSKEQEVRARKIQRWADRNKDHPERNPFLEAIRPDHDHYGDPEETAEELRMRLTNLEYGNYPGYFNYRNKASVGSGKSDAKTDAETIQVKSDPTGNVEQKGAVDPESTSSQPLESGLSDNRLKFLKRDWFENKNVLDIGCNSGHMTYAIARLFNPKSIVGIDIDQNVIKTANIDIKFHLEDGLQKEARERMRDRAAKQQLEDPSSCSYQDDPDQLPLPKYISQGPLIIPKEDAGESTSESRFPNNLIFVEHNYVLAKDELIEKQKPYYDTITCLSVTKWVHLNYRDAGIKRFFKRVYRHLKPDGLFILEAQPYDNYGRRKKLSDRLKANYSSIQFKPDQFDAYLLSEEVGFRQIVYSTVTEHECAGFQRPLKVFLK